MLATFYSFGPVVKAAAVQLSGRSMTCDSSYMPVSDLSVVGTLMCMASIEKKNHYRGKFSRGLIFTDRQSLPFRGFKFCWRARSCPLYIALLCLFRRFNFCGQSIIHENRENWTPRNFPAILIARRYVVAKRIIYRYNIPYCTNRKVVPLMAACVSGKTVGTDQN